jgi:hypothetical protein
MFPDFFAEAPRLSLFDPLAQLLGAPADGSLEYGYADAVRLAGHSCPTVASTYLMTRLALRALYPETLPVRGEISVQLGEAENEGVAGVMALNIPAGISPGRSGEIPFPELE